MKTILAIALLMPTMACAYDDSPYSTFSTDANFTTTSIISWEPADDVQAACDANRRKRGRPPYSIKVKACSFWSVNMLNQNICHIVTKRDTTIWSVGHEIRHCFQRNWHE